MNCSDCLLPVSTHLLSVLLPGEECSRHEEAVQTSEVQPAEGGKPREQGQQGSLCYAASRQGQALQFRAQAKAHLRRKQHKTGRLAKVCVFSGKLCAYTFTHTDAHDCDKHELLSNDHSCSELWRSFMACHVFILVTGN